jgi:hypothetical protein
MDARNVPATKAPLPFREHPDTPTLFGSILAAGVFSMASIIRRTPQALLSYFQIGHVKKENGQTMPTLHLAKAFRTLEG